MQKHRTMEEINLALNEAQINGKFKIIGSKYIKQRDKTICKCNKCNREWETNFGSILSGCGCKVCKDKEFQENQRIEKESLFNKRIQKLSIGYQIDGIYKNENSKFNCACNKCGYVFKRAARQILQGCECPQCRFKRVGKERRKTHELFIKDLSKITDEVIVKSDYKTNHDKVVCECKYCGFTWNAKPNVLLSGVSLKCKRCSTSDSVPNRFMLNCLIDADIKFEQEKIFNWSNKKRYDFYIPSLNTIIEMHGGQHYYDGFSSFNNAKSLKENQMNDEYKMNLAKENGIEHYIIIDSRNSTKKWLSEHLLQSNIGYVFENINFDDIFKRCYISSTAKFADLYNSGITNVNDLMNELNISRNSVYRLKSKARDAQLIAS